MAWDRAGIPASRKDIEDYRNVRLKKLLDHAWKHVPYYRKLFDQAGITPEHIREVSGLNKLPVSTKDDLRAHDGLMLSDKISPARLITKFTTGSTGEPFHIRRTFWEAGVSGMVMMRNFRSYGWRRQDTVAVISMHARARRKAGLPRIISGAMNYYAGKRVHLNCLGDPESLADQILRIRPDIVLSYAGILARIGDILSERKMPDWRPRFLLSGSETLTPIRRRQMEAGFGARAYDYYAAYESGMIAWECRETGLYHVADDHIILEVEQDGKPVPPADGVHGETVITNLHSLSMPFIRYRLNDTVVCGPATCPCGAPFSTLRSIEGRRIDYFILPDGRHIHPLGISRAFIQACPGIKQYQIIQETPDRITVRIVHSPSHPHIGIAAIPEQVKNYVGMNLQVNIDFVDHLRPEPTGKYKLFASHVSDR